MLSSEVHLILIDIGERMNPHRARHVHEGPELLAVVAGEGRQLTVRGEEPCKAGDIFLFPAGHPHNSYAAPGERFTCAVLLASPEDFADGERSDGGAELFARLADLATADHRLRIRPATAQQVKNRLLRAIAEHRGAASGGRCAARAEAMQALVALARDPLLAAPAAIGPSPPERHIAEARRWIDLHWMQPIEVADLVALGALGRSQFLARFRDATGMTVGQALLAVRLREAKRMLRAGEGSMLDIALACGFGSQSHFNHRFRAAMGASPRDWMRSQAVAGSQVRMA